MVLYYYEQAGADLALGRPELSCFFKDGFDWIVHRKENGIKNIENNRSKLGLLTSKKEPMELRVDLHSRNGGGGRTPSRWRATVPAACSADEGTDVVLVLVNAEGGGG